KGKGRWAYLYPKGSASWSNLRAVFWPSSCCFAAENSRRQPRGKLVHPQGHRSSLGAVSEQSGITLAKTVASIVSFLACSVYHEERKTKNAPSSAGNLFFAIFRETEKATR